MDELHTRRRRRRAGRPFVSMSFSGRDLGRFFVLALFPAGLSIAHLSAGANSTGASLWLTVFLALALAVAVCIRSASAKALRAPFLPMVAIPLALTLLVAVWTLIGVDTGANPILGEAGLARSLSIDRSATILELLKLTGLACAFLVGCIQGGTVKRALATCHVLVVTGATYSLVAFGLYFTGNQARAGNRLTAGFLSANTAATLLGVLLVIAVALLIRGSVRTGAPSRRRRLKFAGLAVCVAILAVALLMTASRMGLAATGAALLVLLLWTFISGRKRFNFSSFGWAGVASLAGLALLAAADIFGARAASLDSDAVTRSVIFASHWRAFLASPAFGYGLGSFTTVNNIVMTPENYGALWSIRAAHNVYIQWLEEGGVIGSLPMFVCIAIAISYPLINARRAGKDHLVLRGLIAVNIVVLVHSITDYSLQVPSFAASWAFLLGLTCALGWAASAPQISKAE